jgi:hypothetical protein
MALDGEWLSAEAASDATPGAREKVTQRSLRLLGVYGPTERLNLVAQVPLVRKEVRYVGGGISSRVVGSGLGDAELGMRWFAWRRTDWGAARRQAVALSMGSSLPTGEADAREGGVRLDDHQQLGSGAWGPYAGLLYRLEQLTWDAYASATVRWRSENRWGYRYGASIAWTAQAQWQPHDRIALGLGLDGREAVQDELNGRGVPNTGGLVLAAAPGLYFGATEDLWISVRAQFPIATKLVGDQRVGPVVVAGAQWTAH